MTTVIVFSVLIGIECLIICVGNAFTIFVFWNHRSGSLRRTCYLLLNLAIVDLLAGVVEPVAFATRSIPALLGTPWYDEMSVGYYFLIFAVMFSTISVVSLAFISLERTFAVLRPLVHRTTSARVYIYCVAFTWAAGITVASLYILPALRVSRVR